MSTIQQAAVKLANGPKSGMVFQRNLLELQRAVKSYEDTKDAPYYVEAAKSLYHRDGEVEVDEGAVVSEGADNGAYVAAWVWVPEETMKDEKKRIKAEERKSKREVKRG